MRTTVKGKNYDVSDRDRSYAEAKLRRLERMLDDRSEAIVELSREDHRSVEKSRIADVSLVIDGQPLHGHAAGPTHRAALDDVIDKLERRAVSHKSKPVDRRRQAGRQSAAKLTEGVDATDASDDGRPRVVKVKRFAIEPMFEEDAVARMEELGHTFFIFVNAENEQVAVLYRRADGDYGLIEPAIGGEYTPGAGRRRRAS
jgi:putative sigma-54 modulation protein